jgi:hypothetical protein
VTWRACCVRRPFSLISRLRSTTIIKQEPIDKVDTIFPLEVSSLSFAISGSVPIATSAVGEAGRSTSARKFSATSAHDDDDDDDDDDEDEEIFDDEQLDDAELALERG